MFKKLLSVVVLIGASLVAQAEEFEAGKHYEVLPTAVKTADPSKVEVTEMFGYPCPHCNTFEPLLKNWVKQQADGVDFKRIPVVFGRSWEPMARAYYTAELLDEVEKTHQAMFDAVHLQRKRFRDLDALADHYADLGVDRAKFEKTFNSFAVNTKLNQGDSKVRSYQIDGVPSMVVNGKYRITAAMAGGQQQMLKVVDYLIKKEQQ